MKIWAKIVICALFWVLYFFTGLIIMSALVKIYIVDIAAFAIIAVPVSVVCMKIVEYIVEREQRRWN